MSETVQKRRRGPWLALAAVLLVAGGLIAWQYRPLNAAEKALVGRWTLLSADRKFEFRSDRRLLLDGESAGTWSASANSLSLRSWMSVRYLSGRLWLDRIGVFFQTRLFPCSRDVTWVGPDRFALAGNEFVRSEE